MIDSIIGLRVTYDKNVDAAYIYFQRHVHDGEAVRSLAADDETNATDIINLDLDASDRLLGIEVLSASQCLPAELLRALEASEAYGE